MRAAGLLSRAASRGSRHPVCPAAAAATPAGEHGVDTCRLCPNPPGRRVTFPCMRHRGGLTKPRRWGWEARMALVLWGGQLLQSWGGAPHRGESCCLRNPRPEGGQGPALTSRGPCCESVTRSPSSRISVVGVPPTPGTPTSRGSRPPHPCSAASPERPVACALP